MFRCVSMSEYIAFLETRLCIYVREEEFDEYCNCCGGHRNICAVTFDKFEALGLGTAQPSSNLILSYMLYIGSAVVISSSLWESE